MGDGATKKRRRLSIRRPVSSLRPAAVEAKKEARAPKISAFAYGPDGVDEHSDLKPEELHELLGKHPVTWIDVDGLGDFAAIERIGRALDLHPLALEDATNLDQRPKFEEYPSHAFLIVRMARCVDHVFSEQLAIFLGPGFIVTFQGEQPGDSLEPVRKRIRLDQGRIRSQGPDYLAYAIVDAVIDNYFPVIDQFGDILERLEDELSVEAVSDALERIQHSKQDLLLLRRAILPMRDVVNTMVRDESRFIGKEARLYLRDCYDHTVQIMDVVASYRELTGGLMELYLSGVSNRMNEIMKFLTLVSTIFIPLTFIVGVYGMNFDPARSPYNMPELEYRYGYPVVVGVMVLLALGLVFYFRRKGWLAPTR
jgi:magnesium transporter